MEHWSGKKWYIEGDMSRIGLVSEIAVVLQVRYLMSSKMFTCHTLFPN